MRKFQEECHDDINILLKQYKIEMTYEVLECEENLSIGHKKDDVYMRYQFKTENNKFDTYIYTDEAGTYINDKWYIFELPDYDNDTTKLKLTFVEFIKLNIIGLSPEDVIWDVVVSLN